MVVLDSHNGLAALVESAGFIDPRLVPAIPYCASIKLRRSVMLATGAVYRATLGRARCESGNGGQRHHALKGGRPLCEASLKSVEGWRLFLLSILDIPSRAVP